MPDKFDPIDTIKLVVVGFLIIAGMAATMWGALFLAPRVYEAAKDGLSAFSEEFGRSIGAGEESLTTSEDFRDDAPNAVRELYEARDVEDSPILRDFAPRLERFDPPPSLQGIIQYRNYLFITMVDSNRNVWTATYRWNGNEWEYVEFRCQDCQLN